MRSIYGALLIAGILLPLTISTGCSKPVELPTIAKVKGKLLYQGEPVPNAIVTFMAVGLPKHSAGRTNESGEFQLTTDKQDDGAFVGTNKVTVVAGAAGAMALPDGMSAEELAALPPEEAMRRTMEAQKTKKPDKDVLKLPEAYGKAETTTLEFTVVYGENDFMIELND
jgi:hypothetical protein